MPQSLVTDLEKAFHPLTQPPKFREGRIILIQLVAEDAKQWTELVFDDHETSQRLVAES